MSNQNNPQTNDSKDSLLGVGNVVFASGALTRLIFAWKRISASKS